MFTKDTIAAPATPLGEGGIGIVRISGTEAESLLTQLFQPSRRLSRFHTHRLYHGKILSPEGRPLDEVMAVLMRKPHSYTCEDVVEVHCHGGPFVVRKILESFIRAGARLASPGEFTLRAFLNGRLDLTRAEGVIDLIRSRSEKAAAVALQQLEGRLGARLSDIREKVVEILTLVEAYVDFPDEDLSLPHRELIQEQSFEVLQQTQKLLDTFNFGRVAREGMGVLLVGRPNAGKSSLLNVLLGEERAIVTPIPGTTRDIIEEAWSLEGFSLRLIDTAGIHDSSDPVEVEGMKRTLEKVRSADLLLVVVDGSKDPDSSDFKSLEVCEVSKIILVFNKSDLGIRETPKGFSGLPLVRVSARTGEGIDNLKKLIVEKVTSGCCGLDADENVVLSSRRHWESLINCRDSVERFHRSLGEDAPYECLAVELREALQSLGEVTGETLPEEVLNRIFSRFCIGK